MKLPKAALLVFFSLLLFIFPKLSLAQTNDATIHFFYSNSCPHCAKESIFLDKIKEDFPQVKVNKYEISTSLDNQLLLKKMGKELHADTSGVPFTVIGEKYFTGYLSDETTGEVIKQEVENILQEKSLDITKDTKTISLPIIGILNIKSISLPALTVVIAFLDGFNPCAMWVLLFLISLLLNLKDKKKMWVLGITFIFTSGLVYFLFLSAWLNLFLFLGFVSWIRIIIGLVAISASLFYLWDYCKNKGVCKTIGSSLKSKVFTNLKNTVSQNHLIVSLVGIILLAAFVNLIELACSAGLPAVFTQVLSLSGLPVWQYYLYLLVYIFIFMFDDLFVFVVAMITLQATGISTKYSRFSRLVGSLVLLVIGLLMLLRPDLLIFS